MGAGAIENLMMQQSTTTGATTGAVMAGKRGLPAAFTQHQFGKQGRKGSASVSNAKTGTSPRSATPDAMPGGKVHGKSVKAPKGMPAKRAGRGR